MKKEIKNTTGGKGISRGNFIKAATALVATSASLGANAQPGSNESKSELEQKNKDIIIKWLGGFWGPVYDETVIDSLAAPDMILQYSLHKPRKGHADIKDFMKKFRDAFPNLAFDGAHPLLVDGEYVIARWIGGGTHTGTAFNDWPVGSLPAATGRIMRFTGTTVFRVVDGKVKEEIGLDDGLTALLQLKLVKPVS